MLARMLIGLAVSLPLVLFVWAFFGFAWQAAFIGGLVVILVVIGGIIDEIIWFLRRNKKK